MYQSSPLRSTLNTGYITGLDMCTVCTEAVHSVALLNTGYITGLDMCKVCTGAVHSVAIWTRVTLQVWTCVKYVPKQSIAQRFEHVCKCKRMSSSPPHPTPPYPMWCVREWLLLEKWCKIVPVCTCDSSLCVRVTLENGCARTWLQSVCAGDSGWKKWCKIVPVCTCDSRACARVTPWPFWRCTCNQWVSLLMSIPGVTNEFHVGNCELWTSTLTKSHKPIPLASESECHSGWVRSTKANHTGMCEEQ